jgi:hypothetical protein
MVRRLDDWPHARHVRLSIIQAVESSKVDLVRCPRRIRLFLFHVVPRHGLWYYRPDQGPPGSQVEKGQLQLEIEATYRRSLIGQRAAIHNITTDMERESFPALSLLGGATIDSFVLRQIYDDRD